MTVRWLECLYIPRIAVRLIIKATGQPLVQALSLPFAGNFAGR
jgi:hypothetical protein